MPPEWLRDSCKIAQYQNEPPLWYSCANPGLNWMWNLAQRPCLPCSAEAC